MARKMNDSRIHLLLEELSDEIKSVETKNRTLYASAVDIEDEALSLKVQAESFATLRKMRGLKTALITFKTELEQSGLLLEESDNVYISNEHGSIGVSDFAIAEVSSPQELAPDLDFDLDNEQDFDNNIEFEPEESVTLPSHITEEIEAMGDIMEALNESTEEIDDSFDDLIQSSLDELSGFDAPNDDFADDEPVIESIEDALESIAGGMAAKVDEDIAAALEGFETLQAEPQFESLQAEPQFEPLQMESQFEPLQAEPQFEPLQAEPQFESLQAEPQFESLQAEPQFEAELTAAPAVSSVDDFLAHAPDKGIYSDKTPDAFVIFGKRVEVRNWSDMLIKVCEILILKNPYTVAQFDKYNDLNSLGNCYFSYNRSEIKNASHKLSNGLWIELDRTPDDVVTLSKKMMELCGYPRNELDIEIAAD